MGIARVGAFVSSYSNSVTKSVTAGNWAVFMCSGAPGTITAPTKSGTCTIGTIYQAGSTYSNGYNEVVGIFYMNILTSGTLILTVNGTFTDPGCSIHEYSGFAASPLGVYGAGSTGTTTTVSDTLTGVSSDSVVIMIGAEEDGAPCSGSANSPYTKQTEEANHYHTTIDYIVPSAGNYTPSIVVTTATRWAGLAAEFKAAAGGAPSGVLSNIDFGAFPKTMIRR